MMVSMGDGWYVDRLNDGGWIMRVDGLDNRWKNYGL